MNNDEAKRFLDELEASGDNIGLWADRKERENRTFTGLEVNPEKLKRLNEMRKLCQTLHKLNGDILYKELPFDSSNRHGGVQISFLPLEFITDKRITNIMAKLFARADHFTIIAPRLADEDSDDEDFTGARAGREVAITFDVADMWQTYGKAPFGI